MADAASIPIPGRKSSRRAQHPLAAFSARLQAEGWLSPDTYGNDFAEPGDVSAVYMFVVIDMHDMTRFHVAYVGMSKKLASRWAAHPTLRKIRKTEDWVKRLFKPTSPESLRDEERRYIQEFCPPWNIIGRVAGK